MSLFKKKGEHASSALGNEATRFLFECNCNILDSQKFGARARKIRALIMVSKFCHWLVDLLYCTRIGAIPIEVPLIVSNHRDYEDVAVA